MLKRILLAALLLVLVLLVGRWLVHAIVSEETRIRWTLEEMADGFNDTDTNQVLAGLAPDYFDDTYGADRPSVRQALAYVFLQRKDPVTKGFLYEVELPEDEITIELVGEREESARVTLLARFSEKNGDERKIVWETRVKAEMVERDGEWMVLASEQETVSGRLLR